MRSTDEAGSHHRCHAMEDGDRFCSPLVLLAIAMMLFSPIRAVAGTSAKPEASTHGRIGNPQPNSVIPFGGVNA